MNLKTFPRRAHALAFVAVLLWRVPAAFAEAPINGGPVTGFLETVNASGGEQTDPHISGNLAVYTDFSFTAGEVRYYDFLTGIDTSIPTGANGEVDTLPGVSGSLISFSRRFRDRTACMVYDVSTDNLVEIDPQVGSVRFATAIGSTTVAFVDGSSGGSEIFVSNVTAPLAAPINLSASPTTGDGNPSASPAGDAVVWERCDPSFTDCGVMKAIFSGGSWQAAQVVSDTPSFELNASTDGTYVVYQSDRPSFTGQDIYYQTLTGGAETQLQTAGTQRHPRISQGVIAFESKDSPNTPADLFVYVVATTTLYQVTNTPTVDESMNDITVLPTGEVRVVWAANDDVGGANNIYSRTFTVPLTRPTPVSINITAPSHSIALGTSEQFTATGTYGDGSTANITSQVNWHSSTSAVSISAAGLAMGTAPGASDITASVDSITSNTIVLAVTPSSMTPFTSFTGKLNTSAGFSLQSAFVVGARTDGISPLTETVAIQIGPYHFVISPGSFRQLQNGPKVGGYVFSGIIGGVTLNIQISPIGTNTYEFKISGVPATLVKPVTIKLTIGNDSGELTL